MFDLFRRPQAPPPAHVEPACPTPESTWQVPATAAAGVATRDMAAYAYAKCALPDNLLVDNTRSASAVTLTVNGQTKRAAAGGTVEVRAREVGTIQAYTIVPSLAIAADDVRVYERRIGNGGVPK